MLALDFFGAPAPLPSPSSLEALLEGAMLAMRFAKLRVCALCEWCSKHCVLVCAFEKSLCERVVVVR